MGKLLFKLSEFTFRVGNRKGSQFVLADYLSRAPLETDTEVERVLPLAFGEVLTQPESDNVLNPELTRSRAKAMGITVPDLFSFQVSYDT